MKFLLLFIFGGLGVLSRAGVDQWTARFDTGGFPLSTFAINCFGSFLIGGLWVIGRQMGLLPRDWADILMIGLLGGFTTFSAYSIQTLELFQRGQTALALTYFLASPLCGIALAALGYWSAQALLISR